MSACPYCLTDCGHPETCGAELDEQPSAWRIKFASPLKSEDVPDSWPAVWTVGVDAAVPPADVDEPEHHIEPPC